MYLLLDKRCTVYHPWMQNNGLGTLIRSSMISKAYLCVRLSLNLIAFLQQNCLYDSWSCLVNSLGYLLFFKNRDLRSKFVSKKPSYQIHSWAPCWSIINKFNCLSVHKITCLFIMPIIYRSYTLIIYSSLKNNSFYFVKELSLCILYWLNVSMFSLLNLNGLFFVLLFKSKNFMGLLLIIKLHLFSY